MRKLDFNACLIAAIIFMLLNGCNEPTTTSEKKGQPDTGSDTARDQESSIPPYDPELDPLKVGAQFSKVLADTLNVRMYELTVKPGDSLGLHSHPDHLVYILAGGKAAISFNGGAVQEMEFTPGMGFVSGPVSDAGKNIGSTTIKMLIADIYRKRTQ